MTCVWVNYFLSIKTYLCFQRIYKKKYDTIKVSNEIIQEKVPTKAFPKFPQNYEKPFYLL